MATTIRPVRVNHLNIVVEDFDASVAQLRALFDAEMLYDIPRPEWHACLMAFGGVILELFAPPAFLLNARYGPHYLGIEYQADMAAVRAAIGERGIRMARDIGEAVHTHPADTLGVAFEFYDGEFHGRRYPLLGGQGMRPATWWQDGHPLGLTGLVGYTLAVRDPAAAEEFFGGFLGVARTYEADRSAIVARAIGLDIGDSIVELLTPAGAGAMLDHLGRYGPGIRSTVFGVKNIEVARAYFGARGIDTAITPAAQGFALPPEATLGVLFEFIEA